MEISEGFELIPNRDGAYDARITLDPRGTVINVPEEYDGKVVDRILLQRGFFNFDFIKIEPSVVFIPKTVKTVCNNSQDGSNIPFFAKISPDNPYFCADEKAIFSKDRSTIHVFTAYSDKSYVIPDSVKTIGERAFSGAVCLEELSIPDGTEEIGNDAFWGCCRLTLKLPDTIKKIGHWAFKDARLDGNSALPPNSEKVAATAYNDARCDNVLYLPDRFGCLESGLPYYTFAPDIIIDEDSKRYVKLDGVIYSKDMKTLIAATRKTPSVITVPDGVEVIAPRAFESNQTIKQVILPYSVHTISDNAFHFSSIEKIDLENVKHIGQSAFFSCRLEDTCVIGAESIGKSGFANCGCLKQIHLVNVGEIGENAFRNLNEDAELYITDNVKEIGKNAFDGYYIINVLSPDTGKIKYAFNIFEAESEKVENSRRVINSMIGGERFIDFEKYDEYFKEVCRGKHPPTEYRAAYYRLKYPERLTDEARVMYEAYTAVHSKDIIDLILSEGYDPAYEIAKHPYLDMIVETAFPELLETTVERELTEITAFLINYKNERFPNS